MPSSPNNCVVPMTCKLAAGIEVPIPTRPSSVV